MKPARPHKIEKEKMSEKRWGWELYQIEK